MNSPDIPRLDQRPDDAQPRLVQFRDPERLGRRGFLTVLGVGAMTLGMTVLGWIPLARPARAEPGSEFPDCGTYSNGPGGPICVGAPYSARYCGADKWFLNGCYTRAEGEACYHPAAFCRAAGPDGGYRNAWRWTAENNEWRCADGQIRWNGAPNWETVICSAQLTNNPPPPPEPTTPPPTSAPPSSSHAPRPPWPSGRSTPPGSAEPLVPLPLPDHLPLLGS